MDKKTKKIGVVKVSIRGKKENTAPTAAVSSTPTGDSASATPTVPPTATPTVTPTATPKVTPKPSPKITPTPYIENEEMIVPGGALSKNGPIGDIEEFEYESTAVAEGKTVKRKALVSLPATYKKTKRRNCNANNASR